MRQPGIEPGSTAWKAAMLTTIPLTLTSAASLLLVDCEDEGLGSQHKKKNGVERSREIKKRWTRGLKIRKKMKIKKRVTAVTRIRTWVTAATTQGPNH